MKAFDESRVDVTVDGVVVRAPVWARWKDAVTAADPAAGAALSTGGAWLTDPNGEVVDPDGRVVGGASIEVHEGKRP